jgi:hypothetical protein
LRSRSPGVHIAARFSQKLGKRQWRKRTPQSHGCHSAIASTTPHRRSTHGIANTRIANHTACAAGTLRPSIDLTADNNSEILLAMGMIASLALQTTASLKEMAHLCLVNAIRDAQFSLAVGESTILTIFAEAVLHERPAELRFLKVGLLTEF